MARQTKFRAVRIREDDYPALDSMRELVMATYRSAGIEPPERISDAWLLKVSMQLHLDVLEGRTFAMPMDRFKAGASEMMIKFAKDALAVHGIAVDDVVDHGDTVQFVTAEAESEPVSVVQFEAPAIPASVAVN